MKADYDEIAEKYDDFFGQDKFRKEDYEAAKLLPIPRGKLLDIGCGTGLLLDMYDMVGQHDFEYTGIDPSFKMLKKLLLKYGDKDVECIKFEEIEEGKKYDTIISMYGSPSYIKPRSFRKLKKIANRGATVFLCFIKDGYSPIAHTLGTKKIKVNTFSSYKKVLPKVLYNYQYEEWDNYVLVRGTL